MTESVPHSAEKLRVAKSLRQCLAQLMSEALSHDMHIPALHMRIAILELDDVILAEDRPRSAKGTSKRRGRNAA
jgi:hypothetical protein